MTVLDDIAENTRRRVAHDRALVPLYGMAAQAHALADAERARDGAFRYPFQAALQTPGLSFVCEVKKASPSKGVITEDFPYLRIAREYDAAGADAISCLTEPKWFMGCDEYLTEIVQAVSAPVLRKDFVVDEYMVYQAKVLGAQAVLLICAILDDDQLARYGALARELGMSALVEAHDADEVARALAAGASIVGVNNRNLSDFTVDLGNARALRELVPDDVVYVAESGVKGADDVAAVARTGADAVLIGEALMRAEDKGALLETLRDAAARASEDAPGACGSGKEEPSSSSACRALAASDVPSPSVPPAIKICGLCRLDDVPLVNDIAPEYAGFVFWDRSKRGISADEARALRTALDDRITTIGVFVDAPVEDVAALYEAGAIAVAQLHGTEDEAYLRDLRERCPLLVIWKAFEIAGPEDVACAQGSSADLVLLDAGKGSGTSFDWPLLAGVDRPFALAGGLNPDNVAEALRQCAAAGVVPAVLDVSSGVEADERAADGRTRKDPAKMAAFVQAVRDYSEHGR